MNHLNDNKEDKSSKFLQEVEELAKEKRKALDNSFNQKNFDFNKLTEVIKDRIAGAIVDKLPHTGFCINDKFVQGSHSINTYEMKKIVDYANDLIGKDVASYTYCKTMKKYLLLIDVDKI